MISTVLKSRWLWLAVITTTACPLAAMDHISLRRDGEPQMVDGRVVLEAQDGGLLVLARDEVLWRVLPTELVKRDADDAPFRVFPQEQMARHVLADLPKGFEIYVTKHYMICHNTSQSYAKWCGTLFERLYAAFRNNWSRQGFEMVEPEARLVAVIFADKASYVKFSRKELGEAADSIYGYYNMESNRMIMYDLAGMAMHRPGRSVGTIHINQFLASPAAAGQVSTIVHEATHQIAFNSGLHQRLSDCPKWFSEGIAMYCETPDLSKGNGWAGIGVVNRPRLGQFQEYMQHRVANSLKTLVSSDERLVDVKQAVDAYSESWALTYFLIHKYPKQYIAYLKVLSRKQPLKFDDKATRLAEFEKQFGRVEKVDAEFMNYVQTYLR
jgi:hypothetical protein